MYGTVIRTLTGSIMWALRIAQLWNIVGEIVTRNCGYKGSGTLKMLLLWGTVGVMISKHLYGEFWMALLRGHSD